jgi:hypothetical protein
MVASIYQAQSSLIRECAKQETDAQAAILTGVQQQRQYIQNELKTSN